MMGGIPHIYDSPYFFNIYETTNEEYQEIDYEDYSELSEQIEKHIIEEKKLMATIKRLEPKQYGGWYWYVI